jgi:hypothetical protein
LRLPEAFRSLPRPSSPVGAKASIIRLEQLDRHKNDSGSSQQKQMSVFYLIFTGEIRTTMRHRKKTATTIVADSLSHVLLSKSLP